MKLVFPVFSVIQKKLDKVNTVVHENVSGARVVKAFGKEDYEYERFVNTNNDYTFNDLFWGIADIPFITLSNFLGFELFGVELFTAFCSILSVAVILWVVRKIL